MYISSTWEIHIICSILESLNVLQVHGSGVLVSKKAIFEGTGNRTFSEVCSRFYGGTQQFWWQQSHFFREKNTKKNKRKTIFKN